MKIDVVLASRGNPLRLMSVLTCFDNLASGTNDITYRVIVDEDDELTVKAAKQIPLKIVLHEGSRDIPMAARINEAAMMSTADLVSGAADDTFPLTQHWDGVMQTGFDQGFHAFSWQEANDPENQTLIVLSRKWLDCIGRFLPEYFPFWFGDTWIAEVHELAFAKPLPIVSDLQWGGRRGKTRGMRELKFWFEFFAATRIERLAEAQRVHGAFSGYIGADAKWNTVEAQASLTQMRERDAYQLSRVPHYEQLFGANEGEPTPFYTAMRGLAGEWLKHHQ